VRELVWFLFIKNIAYPVITLFFLYLLQPPFTIALMILLQSAVPPVTAIPVIVEIAVTNTVNIPVEKQFPKLKVLSVGGDFPRPF